jgi:hypothetical protein
MAAVDLDPGGLTRRVAGLADAVIVVASALRYGDATIWATLRAAHAAPVRLGLALTRVPPGSMRPVYDDLLGRLQRVGLGTVPVLTLVERPNPVQLFRDGEARRVRDWVRGLVPETRLPTLATAALAHSGERLLALAEGLVANLAATDRQPALTARLRDHLEALASVFAPQETP